MYLDQLIEELERVRDLNPGNASLKVNGFDVIRHTRMEYTGFVFGWEELTLKFDPEGD